MLNVLLKSLPKPIRELLRKPRTWWIVTQQRAALERLAGTPSKRIVIGSSGTRFRDWVSTDRETLDLLQENTWANHLRIDSLDAILAEHVWEHLRPEDAVTAAKTCFKYLKPGGRLRVAVPDGLHPDKSYIESVKPGGTGAGATDHQVLYTYRTLRDLFAESGFEVKMLEYFDEGKRFHCVDWNADDGMVERSQRFDSRNVGGQLRYTSVIIDAVKPAAGIH